MWCLSFQLQLSSSLHFKTQLMQGQKNQNRLIRGHIPFIEKFNQSLALEWACHELMNFIQLETFLWNHLEIQLIWQTSWMKADSLWEHHNTSPTAPVPLMQRVYPQGISLFKRPSSAQYGETMALTCFGSSYCNLERQFTQKCLLELSPVHTGHKGPWPLPTSSQPLWAWNNHCTT